MLFMLRVIFIWLWSFLFVSALSVFAQGAPFLTERIYVAPMRQRYMPGDTVRVEGQVLSSDYEDFYPYSRYVYVDLLSRRDSVLVRVKVRCGERGFFKAALPLGETCTEGEYELCGYTQFMLNDPAGCFPKASVWVGAEQSKSEGGTGMPEASFFPEGGTWVAGCPQKIAVRLADTAGVPIRMPFAVCNAGGDTLQLGETHASGYGSFVYTPEADGGVVSLKIRTADNRTLDFPLPKPQAAVALQTAVHRNRLVCRILTSGGSAKTGFRLFAYHAGMGRRELPVQNGVAVADLEGCTPGVLSLWLTDVADRLLACRALYVGRSRLPLSCRASDRCKVGVLPAVYLTDTVAGSRVILRVLPDKGGAIPHAFETLQLLSEVISPVPFPQYYYQENEVQARQELDAWLCTAVPLRMPREAGGDYAYPYAIEKSVVLSGRVNQAGKDAPLVGGNVQVLNTSTHEVCSAVTDSTGRFEAYVGEFPSGTDFYVQATVSDKMDGRLEYIFDDVPGPPVGLTDNGSLDVAQSIQPLQQEIYVQSRKKVHTLGEADIRARRQLRGDLDVRTREMARSPMLFLEGWQLERLGVVTIEDALRKMQAVEVVSAQSQNRRTFRNPNAGGSDLAPSSKIVKWRTSRYAKLSGEADGNILFFVVDGLPVMRGYDDILSMPFSDVESIELVKPNDPRTAIYGTSQGFVNVKYRRHGKRGEVPSEGVTVCPQGVAPWPEDSRAAPLRPGLYRLAVDVVSPDRTVRSWEDTVTYIE